MKFDEHLKSERQKRTLTQQEVADTFHVSRQTISSWETEHSYPDIESLINLSNYYQISLDILLKEDSGMTEYLKKQEVLKRIKPIIMLLLLTNVLFLALMVTTGLFIKVNDLVLYSIIIMGSLNAIALIRLSAFKNGLSFSTNTKKYSFLKIVFGILVPVLIVFMLVLSWNKQWSYLIGVLSGVIFGLIVIAIALKTKK